MWHRADVSNLVGAISLAFWLCNGIPLVLEIYKRKSADGVSLGFVGLWAIGDVLNLAGCIWAQLVPTTIFVAIYYIFSDLIIIGEAFYYRERQHAKVLHEESERSALLEPAEDTSAQDPILQRSSVIHEIVYNVGACLGVCALGYAGWALSIYLQDSQPMDPPDNTGDGTKIAVGPQILGYTSAMLYLCARIPQIIKNYRKGKCDGLALLFFIFSVCGNVTYAVSILVFSTSREYIITNIPWLLGSLGTLAFDFVILFQFLIFRYQSEHETEPSERNLLNT